MHSINQAAKGLSVKTITEDCSSLPPHEWKQTKWTLVKMNEAVWATEYADDGRE